MKSAKPITGMSKRTRREASTAVPTFGTMPTTEETFVDLTIAMDTSGGADDVDPTIVTPLSLRTMMESFMTT